ncbi:hypothetical protein I79_017651 [Cricetulus griseus]|uniref:Uncharacterized protein n=1 Tax=Cricetulus griseus TaxID=10029 RepID=G3I2L3_CRIGR|nr:hypothetical protein I79_017651 [Cricetulus griseus]
MQCHSCHREPVITQKLAYFREYCVSELSSLATKCSHESPHGFTSLWQGNVLYTLNI